MQPDWAFHPPPAGLPAALPAQPALPPLDTAHFHTSVHWLMLLSLHGVTFRLQSCFSPLNLQLNALTLCALFPDTPSLFPLLWTPEHVTLDLLIAAPFALLVCHPPWTVILSSSLCCTSVIIIFSVQGMIPGT